MSSSTFFTKNITFSEELSTNQSPLPGIGGILSSDANGVFQIAVPPQPPSFVDGLTLQTDISGMGGVNWVEKTASGCVTVADPLSSVTGDFETIFDAHTAGFSNVCVLTSIVETSAIDLSSPGLANQFRVAINPGVTISNTIAASAPWFTGDNTLLTIVGSGAFIDNTTTTGVSSQVVLRTNQALRDGMDAEFIGTGVRFTGSGSNTLTSGTSTLENCRFDTSTDFNFNGFVNTLYVNNCFFDSNVVVESPGILNSTGVVFTNNIIQSHNVNIDAASFRDSIISNNVWDGGSASFGLVVSNTVVATDLVVSGNTMGILTISGDLGCSTISNNTCKGAMTFSGGVIDTTITGNTTDQSMAFGSTVGNAVTIADNTIQSNMTFTGAVSSVSMTGNVTGSNIQFGGAVTSSTISGNKGNNISFSSTVGTLSDKVAISNNISDTRMTFTGVVTGANISGNTSLLEIDFVTDVTNSTVNSNTIGTGGSTGTKLSFGGLFDLNTCTDNNVRQGTIQFVGAVTDSNISGNKANGGNISFDSTVGTLNNKVVISNNLCREMTFTGVVTGANISGNTFRIEINFVTDVTNSTVNSNTGNNLIFGGLFADSTCNVNNFLSGSLTFAGAVTSSTISGNKGNNISFSSTVGTLNDKVVISNNVCLEMTFTGVVTAANISGNVPVLEIDFVTDVTNSTVNSNTIGQPGSGGNFRFGGLFDLSTCNDNYVRQGNIQFIGAVTNSSIGGNSADSLILDSTSTRSTLSDNILGNNLSIDSANTGVSTRNTITGNTCNSISLGSSTGITSNVITSNVAPIGTTTTLSGMGNIVTSNVNGTTTTGFGAGDIIANNV